MFFFSESYFWLVGLFNLGYARTQFLLVSRDRYDLTRDTEMENLLPTLPYFDSGFYLRNYFILFL